TPTGTYTLTITGVSGTLTHTTTVTLVVNPSPDFTLSALPASQTVTPGGATSYNVTISPTGGFSGQVTLSVSGLPGGGNGSFAPNPPGPSSTPSRPSSDLTPTGTYTLTISGVSGTLTHTTTVTLVVSLPPDFTLSASPASQAVIQGGATSYNVTISPTGGFSGQVTLSVSGLPSGGNGTFSPNPASASSTLSVTTSASTPTGTYTLTITGVSGALTHTTTVALTVSAQPNPIVIENQQAGTSQWQISLIGTDAVGQIKGYASATSVNKGENITFYVSVNPAQSYTIDVYRMGWYQGLGGRLMQHIGPLNGALQPACPTDATTGMIECQWASAYTLATQSS